MQLSTPSSLYLPIYSIFFCFISIFPMDSSQVRWPQSVIESICNNNVQVDDGQWVSMEWRQFMWVTMQPSTRGLHKVSKRNVGSTTHHWKGRILELKQGSDGKQLAKVQHVYMASQLNTTNSRRVPVNCELF